MINPTYDQKIDTAETVRAQGANIENLPFLRSIEHIVNNEGCCSKLIRRDPFDNLKADIVKKGPLLLVTAELLW